ncbi:MAG: MerR family transcriptional regulator [bacterium]
MKDKSKLTPKYRISALAKMVNIHPQTIRSYEKLGFIKPVRTKGNARLFSDHDVWVIEKIKNLTQDLGVNLAGVEIILRMRNQIENMLDEATKIMEITQGLAPYIDQDQLPLIDKIKQGCCSLLGNVESK